MSEEAFIYEAIRTPRGKGKNGALNEVKPLNLVTGLIDEMRLRHPNLDENMISDVILGCVSPVGDQGADIARTAVIAAGMPDTVGGVQLNRFCASGLEAINTGAQKVRSGWDDLVIAGGVESMSRVPMGSDGGAMMVDPATNYDATHRSAGHRRRPDRHPGGFTRDDVDAYAVRSQQRAAAAWSGGYFAKSVVPVLDQNGLLVLDHDEHMRPETTLVGLGKLKPAFEGLAAMAGFDDVAMQKYHWVEKINHVHTGGNSSGIVDGAALVLIGRKGRQGQRPDPARPRGGHRHQRRRPHDHARRPTPATEKVLATAGLTVDDIDLFELNEAFASVVLEVPEGPEHPRREAQRQRRRHRDGPPARRHRRHDHRNHGRRARAPRRQARPDHAVHRRRHGCGHHHRARLSGADQRRLGANEKHGREHNPVGQGCRRHRHVDPRRPTGSANVMNEHYKESMHKAVERLEAEKDSITGVVITSGKKTFFAGGDLKAMIQAGPENAGEIFDEVEEIKADLRKLETLGVPVVAAINGAALGGGLRDRAGVSQAHRRRRQGCPARPARGHTGPAARRWRGNPHRADVRHPERLRQRAVPGHPVPPGQSQGHRAGRRAGLRRRGTDPGRQGMDQGEPEAHTQPWDAKGYKMPGGTRPARRWPRSCRRSPRCCANSSRCADARAAGDPWPPRSRAPRSISTPPAASRAAISPAW